MWLLFPLCLGVLGPVQGSSFSELDRIIPRTDGCFIELIKCDDLKIHMTPVDKPEYEFYTETTSLNKFCSENEIFMECIKYAIQVCKTVPHPPTTEELIENRAFAEGFCSPGSPWQRLYLENSGCINSFAHAAEDVCAYKAIDLLHKAPTTKLRQLCLSYVAMRECFIPMISKACGIIAADLIKRVVMYGVGDDFLCNRLEGENKEILEKHWISPARSYALKRYQTTRLFLSDFKVAAELTKPMGIPPTDVYSTIQPERITYSKAPATTVMPHFTSSLKDEMDVSTTLNFKDSTRQTELYFTKMPPFEMDTEQFFDEFSTTPIPATITSSDAYLENTLFPLEETYSFTNFTSFGLYEILDNGDASYLGCGTATVQWATELILKNVFCGWINVGDANNIFKCTIHLGEACIFEDSKKREINMASRKIMLVVFILQKGSYLEVATMKMRNFKPEEDAFTLVPDMVDDKHSEIVDARSKM